MAVLSLSPPPDRIDEEPEILARVRRSESIDHCETKRVLKDGTLIDISLAVSPIREAGGRVTGASKIARDISEQRRAEEKQGLLWVEMKHRTRNFMAVTDAIARQSRSKEVPEVGAVEPGFISPYYTQHYAVR